MSNIFSVDAFKAAMTRGGARPNQFMVTLTLPAYVPGADAIRNAPFLVSAASLPGQLIGNAAVQYRGRQVNFAGDREYQPWQINVLNDSDFTVRNAFEAWMNGMDDLRAKEGVIIPYQYQADLEVAQLDRNGSILKRMIMRDAMPLEISDIGLDFGANNTISGFTASLTYQWFEIDNTVAIVPGVA